MCCHLANYIETRQCRSVCCCCFDATTGDHNGLFDDQSTVLIGASSSTGVDLRPFRGSISGTPVHRQFLSRVSRLTRVLIGLAILSVCPSGCYEVDTRRRSTNRRAAWRACALTCRCPSTRRGHGPTRARRLRLTEWSVGRLAADDDSVVVRTHHYKIAP